MTFSAYFWWPSPLPLLDTEWTVVDFSQSEHLGFGECWLPLAQGCDAGSQRQENKSCEDYRVLKAKTGIANPIVSPGCRAWVEHMNPDPGLSKKLRRWESNSGASWRQPGEILKRMAVPLVTLFYTLAWVWVGAQGLFKGAQEDRPRELWDLAQGPGDRARHLPSLQQEMSAPVW